jgi:gluconolactonase
MWPMRSPHVRALRITTCRSTPKHLPSSAPLLLALAALLGGARCASVETSRPVAGTAAAVAVAGDLPALAGATQPTAIPSAVAFESLEGPYFVSGDGYLLFSDVVEANGAGAKIYRFSPDAGQFSVHPYPAPPATGPSAAGPTAPPATTSTNGLAVDARGRLVACERYNGRVVRLDDASHLTVLAERWPASGDGRSLNAPNDLAIRSDGNIYFTDSDWGTRKDVAHAPMGVYRIDPSGKLSRILELAKPNGIALSPDGAVLYVGSDTQAKVWRLPLDAAGQPGTPAIFIEAAAVPGGFRVPDGICVDDAGDLYVTNNDDALSSIVVFDATGHAKARIRFPARPSNCTFGGIDRRTMYVTTLHAIYQLRVPVAGLP